MPEIQPQKKIPSDAEKLKDVYTLPPVPSARLSRWEQWEEYVKLLTTEQKEIIKWYLYRQKPVIIKPKPFYIQEPSFGCPDAETIAAMHGGGNYRLDIQDAGKQKKICEVFLSIPMSTPPKLNLDELDMNDKSNLGYVNQLIAEGKINKEGQILQAGKAPEANTTIGVPEAMMKMQQDFMKYIMQMSSEQRADLASKLNDKDGINGAVGQILIEKMKQDNPNSMMTVMLEMLKSQKSTASDFAPIFTVISTMMTQLVSMQSENAKALAQAQSENTKLLVEMMKGKDKGDDDDLGGGSVVDKFGKLLELAKMIKGGGNAERGTLEVIMDGVSAVGPSLLQTISQGLQFAMATRGGMPMGMPMATPPGSPSPNMAQEMPSQALPAPNVVEMPKPPNGNQQMTPTNQIVQLLAVQGPLIFQHLENSGAEFADLVVGMYGKPTWAMIAKYEDDIIVTAAKQVPNFWQQVEATYGEAHFRRWIGEFKNYEKILTDREEEGEEPL